MNCIKCGNELPDGAKFCTSCGTLQNTVDSPTGGNFNQPANEPRPTELYTQADAGSAQPVKKPKKKGSFLKILAILIAAIILMSGITVLGYYTFMPAKLTLQIAAAASNRKAYKAYDQAMTLYENKKIKPLYEDTMQTETRLSFSVAKSLLEQMLPPETVDMAADAIKNISLKFTGGLDMKNKKQNLEFGINYMLNPILTANLYLDDRNFGLGVPELSEKYIVGNLKDLGNLSEVFPDISPEILKAYENTDPWISSRMYEELKIDREDLKKVMEDYTKELINSIDSKDMKIKRGQSTEVIDKKMSCQEITITLDDDAQREILKNLIEKMKDDDTVYELTFGKIKGIYDILGENEYYQELIEESGLEDFLSKDAYEENLSKLADNLDDVEFLDEIEVKIYIKNLDIVKYAFNIAAEEDILFTIEKISDGLSYKSRYSLSGGAKGNSVDMVLSLNKSYDEAKDITDHFAELDISMDIPEGKGTINLTCDSNEEPEGKNGVKHTVDFVAKVNLTSNGNPVKGDITITLDGTKARNSKGLVTESDYTGEIGVNAPDYIPEPIKLGFAVDTERVYGEEIDMPEPDEVLDIATATEEDYDQFVNEMYEKLGSLMMVLSGF